MSSHETHLELRKGLQELIDKLNHRRGISDWLFGNQFIIEVGNQYEIYLRKYFGLLKKEVAKLSLGDRVLSGSFNFAKSPIFFDLYISRISEKLGVVNGVQNKSYRH